MNSAVHLGLTSLVLAFFLVMGAAVVSWLLELDLERRILWASLRATIQLLLVGYALTFVFETPHPMVVAVAMGIMVAAASRQARARPGGRLPGAGWGSFLTLGLVSIVTVSAVSRGLLEQIPWYNPRYALPLLGMILGNTLNGLALTLERLAESFSHEGNQIEADLALGATRFEALRVPIARAVRFGMTPIVNSTSVVGLVALPGMMTGQLLAGADPQQAVRYQLLIVFVLLGATAVSTLILALLVGSRLIDAQHRLRPR